MTQQLGRVPTRRAGSAPRRSLGRVTQGDALPFLDPGPVERLDHALSKGNPAGAVRRAKHDVDAGTFPALRAVALDATNAHEVAEFYRELLGYTYRLGDEAPPPGHPDPMGEDWLVLRDRTGEARLAVQHVAELPPSTWPDPRIPQQLHLDLTVADIDALALGTTGRSPRREGAARPVHRPRRTALRVRRPGRASFLHLRLAGPSELALALAGRWLPLLVRYTECVEVGADLRDRRVDRGVRALAGDVDCPAGEDVADPVELRDHAEELDDVGQSHRRSGLCAPLTASHSAAPRAGAAPRADRARTRSAGRDPGGR